MNFPLAANEVPLLVRQTTGFVLVFGMLFGVYALAAFVIAMALRRRTLGWIIVGSLSAFVILTSWLLIVAVIGTIIYKGYQRQPPLPKHAFADSSIPHSMQGWTMAYKIVLPRGWMPDWSDRSFDMTAERDGLHLGVVAGQSVGDDQVIERMTRDRIKAVTKESYMGDSSPVEIDGHAWLQFSAHHRQQAPAPEIFHQFYVYSGFEGMFQVVGWRIGGFQADDLDALRTIAQSFRFPLGPSPPTPVPLTVTGAKFAYQLMVPAGWTVERFNASDLKLTHQSQSVRVMVSENPLASAETALRNGQDTVRLGAADPHFDATSTVKIDEHDWLGYTATWTLKSGPYSQEYYVHAGPEGLIQLTGVTPQAQSTQNKEALHRVLLSFRFPAKN